MRITLKGKFPKPWDEDDLLRSGSWLSGQKMHFFSVRNWWVGIGFVWIQCLCCKMKRPAPKPFSAGTNYFQIGYFAISARNLRPTKTSRNQ